MKRNIYKLLKDALKEKKPKTSTAFDRVVRAWWNGLTADERFEVTKEIAKGKPIEDIIVRCGCSESSQRCGVKV